MLGFDFDDQRLVDVAAEYDATPKQLDLARNRAVKRTAGTIRRLASTGLKTELGLRNAKALRRRVKEFKVGKGRNSLKIWFGANDLPFSAFKGRPRQVPGGVQFGNTMVHGAFIAKVSGRRGVFQRVGARAYPIVEATLPVADRMMIYLEDEVFIDVDNIFFKHFTAEIRARTMLGVGDA